jgi:hypothetical protein
VNRLCLTKLAEFGYEFSDIEADIFEHEGTA